jgi:hypothetical protein
MTGGVYAATALASAKDVRALNASPWTLAFTGRGTLCP